MKSRKLRGLAVTELGFGAASLGNLRQEISDDDATATVEAAWAGGIRYFDTAPHYGLGLSERRLGRALARHPREDYLLSTKVGRLLEPNPAPTGSDLATGGFAVPDTLVRRFDFSADAVRRSLESSLERLGLDRIDVVYVHDPDDHLDQAVQETVPALVRLREEGVIDAVGVGTIRWPTALRLVRESDLDAVMLAGRWTLLDRSGAPLLEQCAHRGVSVVAAAPFNSGLLAQDRPSPDAHYDYAPVPPDVLARVNRMADTCDRHGTRLPSAALQFPLRSPSVVSVVCGLQTTGEVDSALDHFARPVPATAWPDLDRTFP
jgi:D-threo-aldose 1-dehydrogenase